MNQALSVDVRNAAGQRFVELQALREYDLALTDFLEVPQTNK